MSRLGFRLGIVLVAIAIGLMSLGLAFSGYTAAAADPDASLRAFQRAVQVHGQHSPRLLSLKDVAGTAMGVSARGEWAVKVYTIQAGVAGIPEKLDGVPVEVEVTGAFFALKRPGGGGGTPIDPTGWFARPVPIGVSTGNWNENSAGTIGCRVKDSAENVYALSNNHVYARENDATSGETIVQPGRYDTNGVYDAKYFLGTLSTFVPIDFRGFPYANTVDAAIALCPISSVYPSGTLGNATPLGGYGIPKSAPVGASLRQAVQKYGRTTSLTKGYVSAIKWTGNVTYSSGTAYFTDQIVVTANKGAFIGAGDSGSLLVTDPGKAPVGLLFAGNANGRTAIANRIDLVLGAFGVSVDGK
jgi:hypothetical protein